MSFGPLYILQCHVELIGAQWTPTKWYPTVLSDPCIQGVSPKRDRGHCGSARRDQPNSLKRRNGPRKELLDLLAGRQGIAFRLVARGCQIWLGPRVLSKTFYTSNVPHFDVSNNLSLCIFTLRAPIAYRPLLGGAGDFVSVHK